jgi:protein-disulfide isomerase
MTTAAYSSSTKIDPPASFWLQILCVVGLSLSAVALYEHVIYSRGLATGPSFCNISSRINCEAVNASEWSVFFGLPIASYGLFFYTSLLGVLTIARRQNDVALTAAASVAFLASFVASLVSLALFAISHFIIGALCLICIGLYVVNFLMVGILWLGAFRGCALSGLTAGVQALCGFVRSTFAADGSSARKGLLGVVVLGLLSALAPEIVYSLASRNRPTSTKQPTEEAIARWKTQRVVSIQSDLSGGAFSDYSIGSAQAPIQIVEFADFECPGCRVLYARMHELLKKYDGKYRFVFRNYPLDQECNASIKQEFHRYACLAASFTRCAGEQGRFWQALDFVFTDPVMTDERTTLDVRGFLVEQATKKLGLDAQAIDECVTSRRYYSKLQRDIEEANRVGLQSTPAVWINGKQVERPTIDTIEGVFKDILSAR